MFTTVPDEDEPGDESSGVGGLEHLEPEHRHYQGCRPRQKSTRTESRGAEKGELKPIAKLDRLIPGAVDQCSTFPG
jgi:hypothetical protein